MSLQAATQADRRPAVQFRQVLEQQVQPQVAEIRDLTSKLEQKLLGVVHAGKSGDELLVFMRAFSEQLIKLRAMLKESEHLVEFGSQRGQPAASGSIPSAQEQADALRAAQGWEPSSGDLQRGRAALIREFNAPHNLPAAEFAKLAGKSRQQIYKDLAARPARMLALSSGSRGQRIPDWQLNERARKLTQHVLALAPSVDAWTMYHALQNPSGALNGRSPVQAVLGGNVDVARIADMVLEELGVHGDAVAK